MTEDLFGMLEDPQFYIVAGLLIIVLLVLVILKSFMDREFSTPSSDKTLASSADFPSSDDSEGDEGADDEEQEDESEPETERERLLRMETELAEREAKLKAEKVADLEARESYINKRNIEKAEDEPFASDELLKLTEEKKHLQELVKKAEQRFDSGDLEEKNFKMIVSDYQDQIIDIDVKLRKAKTSGI